MVVINDIIFSDEIFTEKFSCNISKCKGICCVEGESGAPLEENEIKIIEDILPKIQAYLTKDSFDKIDADGAYVYDSKEKKYKTNLLENGACVFAGKNENDEYYCNIEKAFYDGKIDFKKPISCHLYPIRIHHSKVGVSANYEQWDICSPACSLGKKQNLTILEFCKDSISRKFGDEVYQQLKAIQEEFFPKKAT